jgi:hypothetical protein
MSFISPSGDTSGVTDTNNIIASLPNTAMLTRGTYYWLSSTNLPLGLNIVGVGWDDLGSLSSGSNIQSTTGGPVIQATGAAQATILQGINWSTGLQIRKQDTTLMGCRIVGLVIGDNSNQCYP